MDPRIIELQYRIEHQHRDGSWGEMVEETSHHDAAAHDPERNWSLRRVFRCTTCGELVSLASGEGSPAPDAG
jgi:hypothetical protein